MKNICTFCIFILRARDPQDISLITEYNIKILQIKTLIKTLMYQNKQLYRSTIVISKLPIIKFSFSCLKETAWCKSVTRTLGPGTSDLWDSRPGTSLIV